jgi:hypothetical protein
MIIMRLVRLPLSPQRLPVRMIWIVVSAVAFYVE